MTTVQGSSYYDSKLFDGNYRRPGMIAYKTGFHSRLKMLHLVLDGIWVLPDKPVIRLLLAAV